MIEKKLNQGSVCASLTLMVVDFCKTHNLQAPHECFLYEIDERIPFNIWCHILEKVKLQTNLSGLGLEIANFIKPPYAGIVSYLSFSKPTLFEAVPEFIHYGRLAYDFNFMHFQIEDNDIEFSWGDYIARPGLLVDENAIALLINIVRYAISPQELPLKSVHFIYEKPNNILKYKDFFKCPIYFNATVTSVRFSVTEIKNISLPKTDPFLHKLLQKQADFLLNKLSSYNQFEQKIRICITNSLKNKKVNIDIIAEQMGLSIKKLRESLQEYGYTFNDILNDVRYDLAKKYLSDIKISINEISDLLGYSEQSVFQRAFKTWSGETPLKWRNDNNRYFPL